MAQLPSSITLEFRRHGCFDRPFESPDLVLPIKFGEYVGESISCLDKVALDEVFEGKSYEEMLNLCLGKALVLFAAAWQLGLGIECEDHAPIGVLCFDGKPVAWVTDQIHDAECLSGRELDVDDMPGDLLSSVVRCRLDLDDLEKFYYELPVKYPYLFKVL